MEFFDPRNYKGIECTSCKGTGKDSKKRTRKCRVCGGSGKIMICSDCNNVICTCYPEGVMF